jgi:hypothetical protein
MMFSLIILFNQYWFWNSKKKNLFFFLNFCCSVPEFLCFTCITNHNNKYLKLPLFFRIHNLQNNNWSYIRYIFKKLETWVLCSLLCDFFVCFLTYAALALFARFARTKEGTLLLLLSIRNFMMLEVRKHVYVKKNWKHVILRFDASKPRAFFLFFLWWKCEINCLLSPTEQ